MGTLSEGFSDIVCALGMSELKHPIFYNSSAGIRFAIGADKGVYLKNRRSSEYIMNSAYISAALKRAKVIYIHLPSKPDILRIDGYPEENNAQNVIQMICRTVNMPLPHEQIIKPFRLDEDDQTVPQLQLYWNLEEIPFTPDKLLLEIIKADIGGYNGFASNVYFSCTHNFFLFHVYDDRGADLATTDQVFLRTIYKKFKRWVLEYKTET